MRILLMFLLLLSACKMGEDYTAPIPGVSDSWHTSAAMEGITPEAWWEIFGDPLLTSIIHETASHNHDVRIAAANVQEARALRKESRSGLLPSFLLGSSAERAGTSNRGGSGAENDRFEASFDATWELDVFGRLARRVEADDARIGIEEETQHDILLSALAEAARNYFEVRGLQKRIEVTKRNIGLVKAVENLAEKQLQAGAVTEFDVARARGERETIEATLPALEADLRAGIYRISVLAGRQPEHYMTQLEAHQPLPMVKDTVPVGLRSDILRRRPDVRRAERELAAASADTAAAVADKFPRFPLTGSVGSGADLFSDLFLADALTWSARQAVGWTTSLGGAEHARVEAASAREQAAQAEHEKAVLVALEDAENSLMRYGADWRTFRQLQSAEKTRQEGFTIAKLRYEAGEEDFLTMLDAERSLIAVQDNLTQSETRILTSLTQLYKALGGGWQGFNESPVPAPEEGIAAE